MPYSAPLEMLTDAVGCITYGWVDEGVYYARFSRGLSARLGEAFAARLRASVLAVERIGYFADGRALESYDPVARAAFLRVVTEHRGKFDELCLLSSAGERPSSDLVSALGELVFVTQYPGDFETRLLSRAPRMRARLATGPASSSDARLSLSG